MKFTFLIIFITVVIGFPMAYGQKSQKAFFYKASFVSDSTAKDKIGTDLMVLWNGNQYSVFESYYGYQRDSVKEEASSKSENPNQANLGMLLGQVNTMQKPSFKYLIHKSFEKSEITVYDNLFFDNYKYIEPISMFKWKIGTETKIILGFNCQKATVSFSGRNFTAWFTEEIPISDGPYVFHGLPGLILQITDDQGYFNFELAGIENAMVEMKNRVLKNPISLQKKAYFSLKKEMYHDIRKALVGRPSGSVGDEALRDLQIRYNRINNPIELKVE